MQVKSDMSWVYRTTRYIGRIFVDVLLYSSVVMLGVNNTVRISSGGQTAGKIMCHHQSDCARIEEHVGHSSA